MANFNKSPLKVNDELIPYSEGLEDRIGSSFSEIADYVANDTGWLHLGNGVYYRSKMNMVMIRGYSSTLALKPNAYTKLTSIEPSNTCGADYVFAVNLVGGDASKTFGIVRANGNIEIYSNTENLYWMFSAMWFI